MRCAFAGRLRQRADRGSGRRQHDTESSCSAPIVGDEVRFEGAGSGRGRILEVLARRCVVVRRAAGRRPCAQPLAANVDLLVAIQAAAEPKPSRALLDRQLALAASCGVAPVICVTKRDCVDEGVVRACFRLYETLGYPVHLVSAARGEGLEELRERLCGRTSVLIGKSGVGKTTLLRALVPGLDAPTAAVSEKTGKGRHTTAQARLHALPEGGRVIDTPGTRELGLWEIGDVERCFPEIARESGGCAGACLHAGEPGCAVKGAVRDGRIDPRRYRSYRVLLEEDGGPGTRRGRAREPPDGFRCTRCGTMIGADAPGTAHRNHCPRCLWSLHLDVTPGDRASGCGGAMEPISVWVRRDGEWAIVHRCVECGQMQPNRLAGDDNEAILLSLACRPLAQPAFPLDRMSGAVPG
jgi:ribosome biogenesis GTPase